MCIYRGHGRAEYRYTGPLWYSDNKGFLCPEHAPKPPDDLVEIMSPTEAKDKLEYGEDGQ
jgi:hypothetical protein